MPDHDLFEKMLFEVSDPSHPSYGQHLNHEEVRALTKPEETFTQAVLAWLQASEVPENDIKDQGEWINFAVSVLQAETMLGATFYYFSQNADKLPSKQIRALKYSVPSNIAPHIALIYPITRFGQLRALRSAPFTSEYYSQISSIPSAPRIPSPALNITACNATITPACLRALYQIGNYVSDPDVDSRFGVCGYLNQYAKYDALDTFLQKYAPYAISQNFSYVLVNDGLGTQIDTVDDDVEANLDIQYAASLAYETNITYYSTAGRGPLVPDLDQPSQADNQNEPYMEFLDYILALPDCDLPQTITTSYGEDEQSVTEGYARTVCDKFGQLGLRGVSILFSSGATGPGSACQTNDGKNTTRFLPIFPASCPYVTSVGGTCHVEPEIAVAFSSGGFSDLWKRPKYQDAAVKEYLSILGSRWKDLYNPEGRGFPDVAAQGSRFHVVDRNRGVNLTDILVGGTSASAPAFAAIISLLNNARLSAGHKPLGFLNPWLYTTGKKGLTDIVGGGSKGCTGVDIYSHLPTPFVPYAGWNATKGWDPVTGLGTPIFDVLLGLVERGHHLGRIE
ncbi:related to tripeptidyl-peptidase I [Rhynchosporium agropyri]|uniref:tripeptidyl-peptidase II n=1 Tax=Rhynchosporium agropyri TaxID=914238 RepID=A0A1E1L3J3_9HELO|nr:related to tripeptidyl-peptidase I [Rhynchosporium agropyri]